MKALLYVVTFMAIMLSASDVWALTTAQKIQILYPNISSSDKAALSNVIDSCSGSYSMIQDGVTVTFTAIRDTDSCNVNLDGTGPNGGGSVAWTLFDNGAFEAFIDGVIMYMQIGENGHLYIDTYYGEGIMESAEFVFENGEWVQTYDSKDDEKYKPTPQTIMIKR
jgi:hypothetical protein